MSTNEETSDLDAFLVSVESKLRGPFSSLDLTRAVNSTALRQSSPRGYLEQILLVLPRMDKVVQVRVLVGLLGLDPSDAFDDVVYNILSSAEKEHEEWVRAVAGLVRGIMFEDGEGSRDSCRGEDAQQLLEKTCQDILDRVSRQDKEGTDLDPLFVPYYYSLLNPDILQGVAPDAIYNPHFQVNEEAEILNIDERNENQKLQDGDEATKSARRQQAAANGLGDSSEAKQDLPTMPGVKALSNPKPKAVTGSKSSLFMPKKPTPATGGRTMGTQFNAMRNGGLHTRKAGAAQALLTKSRRPGGAAPSLSSTSTSATTAGRAMKYGASRSKMKMLDVSEVQGLTKEHQERDNVDNRTVRKRKLMEAAAAKGLVKKAKLNSENVSQTDPEITPPVTTPPVALPAAHVAPVTKPALEATAAAAALLAYQSQNNPVPSSVSASDVPESSANDASNSNWDQLLERSNKLAPEDRERIRQFFVDRTNPTPNAPVFRIKLHEERTTEPGSGVQVKETLYLELDYNTFGFKKLKKTKKK
jgi:hypothetical protein